MAEEDQTERADHGANAVDAARADYLLGPTVGVLADQMMIPWREGGGMYGNDGKLCDTSFSHWDWVAIQRARELGMGCPHPDELDLRFAPAGAHQLPQSQRDWLEHDTALPPAS